MPSLAGLPRLRRLGLRRFVLRKVPTELATLTNLESLMLDSNELRTVPEVVLALPKLKSVVLFHNPIEESELARLRAAFPHIEFSA